MRDVSEITKDQGEYEMATLLAFCQDSAGMGVNFSFRLEDEDPTWEPLFIVYGYATWYVKRELRRLENETWLTLN